MNQTVMAPHGYVQLPGWQWHLCGEFRGKDTSLPGREPNDQTDQVPKMEESSPFF